MEQRSTVIIATAHLKVCCLILRWQIGKQKHILRKYAWSKQSEIEKPDRVWNIIIQYLLRWRIRWSLTVTILNRFMTGLISKCVFASYSWWDKQDFRSQCQRSNIFFNFVSLIDLSYCTCIALKLLKYWKCTFLLQCSSSWNKKFLRCTREAIDICLNNTRNFAKKELTNIASWELKIY